MVFLKALYRRGDLDVCSGVLVPPYVALMCERVSKVRSNPD